jgi:hypothetical protein
MPSRKRKVDLDAYTQADGSIARTVRLPSGGYAYVAFDPDERDFILLDGRFTVAELKEIVVWFAGQK